MTLSRAPTSAKAADLEKLLLLNKHLVKHIVRGHVVRPPLNRNCNPTLTNNPNDTATPKSNGFFRGR